MDFRNAQELLALCEEHQLPISEIMRQREITVGESTADSVDSQMKRVLEIMKDAAFSPIKSPVKSMGGLIGGEAQKLSEHLASGKESAEMCSKKQSPTQWQLWRPTLPWD